MTTPAATASEARDARRTRRETRSGPAAPVRRCLVTRRVRPKDELVRFVAGPDGEVVPDVAERLPGRGLWLTARRDIVDTACAKNLFAKAARARVHAPSDLAQRVERLLARRCLELLGLARRSGQAVAGNQKVRAWLEAGKAGLLLEAADGAADSRARLRALAPGLPVTAGLSAAEMGAALGRERVVHAALAPGGLAAALALEARRLEGFRGPGRGPDDNGKFGANDDQ